ncbi:MAG: FxLYD domain-containing protein [Methanomicrobiales archaeon]
MKRSSIVFLVFLILIVVTATLAGCTQAPMETPIISTQTSPTPTILVKAVPTTVKVIASTQVTQIPTLLPTQSPNSPIIVKNIAITPIGDLVSGQTPPNRVTASFVIDFNSAGGETFPSDKTLILSTDMENAQWSYILLLDGNPNPALSGSGKNLNIVGWSLTYPSKRELSMRVSTTGTVPSVPKSDSMEVIRVYVQDENSEIVPGSEYINRKSYAKITTSPTQLDQQIKELVLQPDWHPAYSGNTGYVVGYIENPTNSNYRGVTVKFTLYDINGNVIGTASDYASVIPSGKTWAFNAVAPKQFSNAEFDEITFISRE